MSGVLPYVNIKPSWHLLLNLLRKVPLHPGDSITFQARFLPCHTAHSSLYTAGTDLGNVPSLNCSDSSLPPRAWSQCLSWALSKRQRYVLERQHIYSPFPQPSVPLMGKPALLRVSASTATLAWPSLTLKVNLLVSNVWVVAVWIHRTEILLQLSHRSQSDGIITSEVKGRTSKIITWNYPPPSFFQSPSRHTVSHPSIPAGHLLWDKSEDTSKYLNYGSN